MNPTNVVPVISQYVRPAILVGKTIKVRTGCGNLYITINRDESSGRIIEVFTRLGKCGDCQRAQNEAITRCVSIGLQAGVPISAFVKQLKGIRCSEAVVGEEHILSCADALAKELEKEVKIEVSPTPQQQRSEKD